MASIYKNKFWTKCPYCEMEFEYPETFKHYNRACPLCNKHFVMKENQGNLQVQIRILDGELGTVKATNKQLEFEIEKEKYFGKLTEEENRRLKKRIRECITQIEELKMEKQKYDQNKEISQNVKLESINEENSRLRELNQKLIEQIKSFKNTQSENTDLKNKIVKLENNEELLRLRNHSQSLLTQIKKLKLDKKSIQEELNRKRSSVDKAIMTDPIERLPEQSNKDIDGKLLEKEEVCHLKNHNQELMEQIKQLKNDKSQEENFKKLQNDNKLLENKLEKIQLEASRLSGVTLVVEKDTNTDPVHTTTEVANHIEGETYKDIEGLTTKSSSGCTHKSSSGHTTRLRHEENHVPTLIDCHNNKLSRKYIVPQRIELGWADPFTVRKMFSALRNSYRLVSSTTRKHRIKHKQDKPKD